jgi:hypothetical protein
VNVTARGFDLLHQRLKLIAVTAAGEDHRTFQREFLGDLAADIVAEYR